MTTNNDMQSYLLSARKQFEYYKGVAEKSMAQVGEDALHWQHHIECNSIVTIIKHLRGNMLSRWTDVFTSDGEKPWRTRDAEFEHDTLSREEITALWNEGWACLFAALDSVTESNWQSDIYIRGEKHTVVDAFNRQLAHIPYHIGQIVFICKMHATENWSSLTVPRGKSAEFNAKKFADKAAKRST